MFKDSMREIWRNLIRRPLQSVLAILGILVGVAGGILLSSMGYGVTLGVQKQINDMGPGVMTIIPTPQATPGTQPAPLTMDDANSLRSDVLDGGDETPITQSNEQVSGKAWDAMTSLVGANEHMVEMRPMTIEQGRFFNSLDVEQAKSVVVIGNSLANKLFGDNSPLGQEVMVGDSLFQVIGIVNMQNTGQADDANNIVFMPITTSVQMISGTDDIQGIMVKVPDPNQVSDVEEKIQTRLQQNHHWNLSDQAVTVYKQDSLLQSAVQFNSLIGMFVNGAVLIAFLLGGIGVMNVMMMAANERQHEIGVYLSFGARPRQIQLQFLLEAVCISLLGVVGGALVGTVTGFILRVYVAVPFEVHGSIYLDCILGGIFLGLVFGAYPSFRASSVKPAEAIRR